MIKRVLATLWKALTHNRCDTCGFTKDEVYVTEFLMEGGILRCKKCINKEKNEGTQG